MSRRRVIVLMLAVAALARPAIAQTDVTERFSKTIHLDQNGTFDVTNISGNIVVTGGGGRDVTIEAVKRAPRRPLLQMIDIQITEQPNRIQVQTVVPRPRNFPGSVDYTITVPDDAAVTLRTVSGDIRATNVRGETFKTMSGAIEITNGAADDFVSASTVSGNVTVRGLKGHTMQFGTVSGGVRLEDVQGDRLTIRAVSGNIDYTGDLARSARYEFVTHSGDIRLMLAGSTGFEVQANSFSGSVHADFPMNGRIGGGGEGGRAVVTPRAVRGAFGDGSAMLVLRAFSGNISVGRR